MKSLRFFVLTLLTGSILFSSCTKEEDPSAEIRLATITEAVVATSSFDVLEVAVVKAGLAGQLGGQGPLTVFAPTDAAFQTYLGVTNEDTAIARINKLDVNVLANLLKYHVVAKQLKANEMTAGTVATLNGGNFTINVSSGVKVTGTGNGGTAATVTSADVVLSNGIIHVIDRVLIPN